MKDRTQKEARQSQMGKAYPSVGTDKGTPLVYSRSAMEAEAQSSSQTPRELILAAFQSGNVCNRVQVLTDLFLKASYLRAIHHFRKLSRTRFLSEVRYFLQSQGLVLDNETEQGFRDKLRTAQCATA